MNLQFHLQHLSNIPSDSFSIFIVEKTLILDNIIFLEYKICFYYLIFNFNLFFSNRSFNSLNASVIKES